MIFNFFNSENSQILFILIQTISHVGWVSGQHDPKYEHSPPACPPSHLSSNLSESGEKDLRILLSESNSQI